MFQQCLDREGGSCLSLIRFRTYNLHKLGHVSLMALSITPLPPSGPPPSPSYPLPLPLRDHYSQPDGEGEGEGDGERGGWRFGALPPTYRPVTPSMVATGRLPRPVAVAPRWEEEEGDGDGEEGEEMSVMSVIVPAEASPSAAAAAASASASAPVMYPNPTSMFQDPTTMYQTLGPHQGCLHMPMAAPTPEHADCMGMGMGMGMGHGGGYGYGSEAFPRPTMEYGPAGGAAAHSHRAPTPGWSGMRRDLEALELAGGGSSSSAAWDSERA
jgi:hypothetical protein